MSDTYICDLMHCVFSTKNRRNQISPEMQPQLWAYLGVIARKNSFRALAVGGTANHVHVLLSLPATISVARAMQWIKGGSSKWIHDRFDREFEWQDGYGSFTVGVSQVQQTVAYINSQEQHHRRRSFDEEFLAFLRKHHIEYDHRYVLG